MDFVPDQHFNKTLPCKDLIRHMANTDYCVLPTAIKFEPKQIKHLLNEDIYSFNNHLWLHGDYHYVALTHHFHIVMRRPNSHVGETL